MRQKISQLLAGNAAGAQDYSAVPRQHIHNLIFEHDIFDQDIIDHD